MTSEEIRTLSKGIAHFRDEYFSHENNVPMAPYEVHLTNTISVLDTMANRIDREGK